MENKERITNNIVCCPHCKELIIIEEINCAIFRHGVFKKTGIQIDPHLSQIECEKNVKNGDIYGCGKPFRILQKDGALYTEICGYE
jgi:hypothetical protein